MTYAAGALEAALSAALGDEPALVAELRQAFFDGAEAKLAVLRVASTDLCWQAELLRLQGLAGSFGVERVVAAAATARATGFGDQAALARIARALAAARSATL